MPSEAEVLAALGRLADAYRSQMAGYAALGEALKRFGATAGDVTPGQADERLFSEAAGRALAALVDEQGRLLVSLQQHEAAVSGALARVADALGMAPAGVTMTQLKEALRSQGWRSAFEAVEQVEGAMQVAAAQLRSLQRLVGETDAFLQQWVSVLRRAISQTDHSRRAVLAYGRPVDMRRQGARFVDRRK